MIRQIAIITAIVCATLLALAVLFIFPEAVIMFLLAFALTAAARPTVDQLTGYGVKRGLAILLTFLYIIVVAVLLLGLLAIPVGTNLQQLSDKAVFDLDTIQLTWRTGSPLQKWLITRLPDSSQFLELISGGDLAVLTTRFLGLTSSVVGFISQALAILILSIYWTIDRDHFERLWLSFLPLDVRQKWRVISQEVEQDLGAYIRSEAVQTLLAGFLLYSTYALLGLPFAALLAVFGAVVWLIPWLGALFALIAVGLIGWWTSGITTTMLALALTIIIYFVLELVVEPRFFKRRRHSTWLTIMLFMALGQTFGLLGMLLAPPLGTTLDIIMRRISQFKVESSSTRPSELHRASNLRQIESRLKELRHNYEATHEEASPQFISLLERLEKLSAEAGEIIR